jgi:hypothetical protein
MLSLFVDDCTAAAFDLCRRVSCNDAASKAPPCCPESRSKQTARLVELEVVATLTPAAPAAPALTREWIQRLNQTTPAVAMVSGLQMTVALHIN